jgi:transcriptional regulator with XRE-family HTH domain
MTELAEWLRAEMRKRKLSQTEVSVYAKVGVATLSDILNKEHVPKVETLCRLADYFETPREQVLRLAGHLPPVPAEKVRPEEPRAEDEALVQALLAEFRRVPDEWKPVAIQQVAQFWRLEELRPARVLGEEAEEAGKGAQGRKRGRRTAGDQRVAEQESEDESQEEAAAA